jgi:hypothetical protein
MDKQDEPNRGSPPQGAAPEVSGARAWLTMRVLPVGVRELTC